MNMQGPDTADSLVLMNADLFNVQLQIVRFITGLFDIDGEQGKIEFSPAHAAKRIIENPGQAIYIRRLLDAVIQGTALPYPPDWSVPFDEHSQFRNALHERIVQSLSEEAENFIVAHEYAHTTLNRETEQPRNFRLPDGSDTISIATRSEESEYSADRLGQEYWYEVLKISELDEAVLKLYPCAPDMLMTTARLLELERERLHYAAPPGEASPEERRTRLRTLNTGSPYACNGKPNDFGDVYHAAALLAWRLINQVADEQRT
jgi:hypothetical protein